MIELDPDARGPDAAARLRHARQGPVELLSSTGGRVCSGPTFNRDTFSVETTRPQARQFAVAMNRCADLRVQSDQRGKNLSAPGRHRSCRYCHTSSERRHRTSAFVGVRGRQGARLEPWRTERTATASLFGKVVKVLVAAPLLCDRVGNLGALCRGSTRSRNRLLSIDNELVRIETTGSPGLHDIIYECRVLEEVFRLYKRVFVLIVDPLGTPPMPADCRRWVVEWTREHRVNAATILLS